MNMESTKRSTKWFYIGLALVEIPLLIGFWQKNTAVFYLGLLLMLFSSYKLCKEEAFLDTLYNVLKIIKKYFILLFILFCIIWGLILVISHFSLAYRTWDVGYFSNIVARFALTGELHSTIINRHPLGEHFHPNLFLLVPFFKLFPSFTWLVFFQIAAYLSSALLLLVLGKRVLGSKNLLIYIAPTLFLVHSYMAKTALFHTQPSAFSLPFILLTFLFAYEKRYIKMFIFLIFLLGFKEHMALIWVSLGFFIMIQMKNRWLGGGLILSGIAIGLITQFAIMPIFNDGVLSPHFSKFQPFALIPQKIELGALALISVGCLPLVAPETLLFILPAFGITFVSNDKAMLTFNHHYQDIALIVLFVGVIIGLKSLSTQKSWVFKINHRYYEFLAACVFFTILLMNSKYSTAWIRDRWPKPAESALYREIKQYQAIAPTDVNLWVSERFGPYFITHPSLKSFDRLGGWQRALADKSPHIILTPTDDLIFLLSDEGQKRFNIKMKEAKSQGKYLEINKYKYLRIYKSVL